MDDEPDIRERYYGRVHEPLEDVISGVTNDVGLRRDVLALIKRVPRRSVESMNIALLVSGYALYNTWLTGAGYISPDDIRRCYDMVKYRCHSRDEAKVQRSIVRYYLFVRHELSGP
jgi:hypothetical protein